MRVRFQLFSLVALGLVAPLTVRGQSLVKLGIAAGATVPTGNYGDAVNTGYNASASLTFSAPLVPVSLRAEGMFNELGFKNGGSAKSRVSAVTGNVVLSTGGLLTSPYLIGGGGWYHSTVNGTLFDASDNQFGFNVGAGIRIPLTGFSAYAEARYHKMLNSDIQFIPITFGVMF